MKTSRSKTECRPLKGLCYLLKAVLLTIVALLAASCKTTKHNSTMHARDSLAWDRRVSVTPVIIPPSLATLRVPTDSLRKLPTGAGYTKKNGRATVSLSYRDGHIIASARCDSLEALMFSLEEQLSRAQNRLAETEKTKEPPLVPFWTKFKWYSGGILTGIILMVIIQFIRKIWQLSLIHI